MIFNSYKYSKNCSSLDGNGLTNLKEVKITNLEDMKIHKKGNEII